MFPEKMTRNLEAGDRVWRQIHQHLSANPLEKWTNYGSVLNDINCSSAVCCRKQYKVHIQKY